MESISNTGPPIAMLLVEDDNATLELLTTTLTKKFPYVALHTAVNGRTGLELFKAHMPDIIITDINMPEMGGVQMADKMRAIKPDTKIIVLTGITGRVTLEASVGNGFEIDHYIVKPVILGELFAAIIQCLNAVAQSRS